MFVQGAELWNNRQKWGTAALIVGATLVAILISQSNLLDRKSPPRQAYEHKAMEYLARPLPVQTLLHNGQPTMRAVAKADAMATSSSAGGGGGRGRAPVDDSRKIVRTGYLEIVVSSPADSVNAVQAIAKKLGGYIASSEVNGSAGQQQSASLLVWVPSSEFDLARNELRGIAKQVNSERTNASDETMHYVDTEATLRNYRAEEARYLEIMKRAVTVKDTLAVSEKLADVRERIDTTESEFRMLSRQVEMTSISVNLLSEPVASSGLNWRPAYRVKEAARLGLESIADFVSLATEFVFQIPAILLWAATIFLGIRIAWYVLKRAVKSFRWVPKASTIPT